MGENLFQSPLFGHLFNLFNQFLLLKGDVSDFSTVQSILFRFGFDNDLNFVLPPHGNHLVNQLHKKELTEPFETEWLDEVKRKIPWHQSYFKEQNYDIFNIHTVWNKSAVR